MLLPCGTYSEMLSARLSARHLRRPLPESFLPMLDRMAFRYLNDVCIASVNESEMSVGT